MSDEPEKQPESRRDLADMIAERSASITFENFETLCNKNEYEVAGKTYKRRILKPKELVKLFTLQKDVDKIKDPANRMENLKQQAQICLEGLTDADWENTDAVAMETIVSACMLISRGFRKI